MLRVRVTWLFVACWHLRDYRETSYSLNFHSWRHIGHRWLVCWECSHFMMQCIWKQCEHCPQTGTTSNRGLSRKCSFGSSIGRTYTRIRAHLAPRSTTVRPAFLPFTATRASTRAFASNTLCFVSFERRAGDPARSARTDRYFHPQLRRHCGGNFRTISSARRPVSMFSSMQSFRMYRSWNRYSLPKPRVRIAFPRRKISQSSRV